jgi:hypothetical protein
VDRWNGGSVDRWILLKCLRATVAETQMRRAWRIDAFESAKRTVRNSLGRMISRSDFRERV